MVVTLTWQTLITGGAVLTAGGAFVALFVKAVRWFDRQEKQDKELKELRKHHDEDIKAIQRELAILTHGMLACLRGLQEKAVMVQ